MTMLIDEALRRFPLLLQTGQREKTYHHSRFRDQAWARKVSPDALVQLTPATAAAHDVAEGRWIRVELAGGPGSCRLKVHLSAAGAGRRPGHRHGVAAAGDAGVGVCRSRHRY